MKSKLFYLLLIPASVLSSCKKDNKKAPDSTISGRVIYNNQPLGVRSNGVQLELWQYGYQLFSKIPVHVDQDGTFSAKVFDGNYKLTLLRGNGPWADNTDSINVVVSGHSNVDVPVDPFFIITDESFTRNGNTIDASFKLKQVNTSKALELVRIYIGQTLITDQNNNAANAQKLAAAITDLSQPVTLNATIPASLAGKDYVFVRVGVKTIGVGELLYSKPQQISIK
jgi:hypothetical protein